MEDVKARQDLMQAVRAAGLHEEVFMIGSESGNPGLLSWPGSSATSARVGAGLWHRRNM